ncbi:MAG TPA: hypothetical protein VHY31_24245, partial [Streptosporangiaceae bacterium]|nr:hypothetical protein [Streptosporangiaceae bacterium]
MSPERDVTSGPLATAVPHEAGSSPGPAGPAGPAATRSRPGGPWKAAFFALMVAAIAAAAV